MIGSGVTAGMAPTMASHGTTSPMSTASDIETRRGLEAEAHILVVEDDGEMRALIARFLRQNGYRVTAVRDGREMWETLAGTPVEVFEDHEPILVPPLLLRTGTHFVMEVRGDSMIDDGIREGDLVIVQQQMTPKNGNTVVAVVQGEATIKRYYQHGHSVELRPANTLLTPIWVEAQLVEIKGVVVGLMRKY